MSTAALPTIDQLAPFRHDQECYEVAEQLAGTFDALQPDAGFYVHPERGPGDHGWNVAADGTIVDMTATQHTYPTAAFERDFAAGDDQPLAAPAHPEIIAPDDPLHGRYVSWTRDEAEAQSIAHRLGYEHAGADVCPLCAEQEGRR